MWVFPVFNEGLLFLDKIVLFDMVMFFDSFWVPFFLFFSFLAISFWSVGTNSFDILLPIWSISSVDPKLTHPSNAFH